MMLTLFALLAVGLDPTIFLGMSWDKADKTGIVFVGKFIPLLKGKLLKLGTSSQGQSWLIILVQVGFLRSTTNTGLVGFNIVYMKLCCTTLGALAVLGWLLTFPSFCLLITRFPIPFSVLKQFGFLPNKL